MKRDEFKQQLHLDSNLNLYSETDPLAGVINDAIDNAEDASDFENQIDDAIAELERIKELASATNAETLED